VSAFTTGFFGKLPSHGDFISRELPSQFIDIWDNWLQLFVSSTQTQLGEDWLDIYLTSPIWRFVLSEGVIDENNWAGILLPSVDRVGRYFPFSIVSPIPPGTNPVAVLCEQTAWFDTMEEFALQALEGEMDIETLLEDINSAAIVANPAYTKTENLFGGANPVSPLLVRQQGEDLSPLAGLPALLDASLRNSYASYSMWSTRGSEFVEPCLFVGRGLPVTTGSAAMLEGQWQNWDWPEPYYLNPLSYEEESNPNE
jgi:type VI secretion-associated protein, BMA_A0400 family